MNNKVLLYTNCTDLNLLKRGKVRDIYDLGDRLLLVATDRLSAFDVILPDGFPGKGRMLNQISLMWFYLTRDIADNHVITGNFEDFPAECQRYPELEGRSMIVEKARPLSVEAIVRGYLSGSGWESYKKNGTVCKIKLPDGLVESQVLSVPVFTPSTKAEEGHDINISLSQMIEILGSAELALRVKEISVRVYNRAREYALERGIIIADTKFEFGFSEETGDLIIIDEMLTPDSSRFWSKKKYKPGRPQDSFDKQPIRDWLTKVAKWDKNPPAPSLPTELIEQTSSRYKEILKLLAP
jgi:phosphoribosylaminoimidazole-succinocarboxamide synthase